MTDNSTKSKHYVIPIGIRGEYKKVKCVSGEFELNITNCIKFALHAGLCNGHRVRNVPEEIFLVLILKPTRYSVLLCKQQTGGWNWVPFPGLVPLSSSIFACPPHPPAILPITNPNHSLMICRKMLDRFSTAAAAHSRGQREQHDLATNCWVDNATTENCSEFEKGRQIRGM